VAAVAVAAAAASFAGVDEIVILAASGAVLAAIRHARLDAAAMMLALPVAQGTAAGAGLAAVGLWPLFAFFVKIGAVLFGSGYVLIAFLHGGLVQDRAWLTEAQLLDAVAIGQVTPGPLSTTATFVGYLVAGGPGAVVATLGIFLPAFVFVALSAPLVPLIRRSAVAASVLDGVNAGALALMGVVAVRLAGAAVVDVTTALLAAASAAAILSGRVHSGWVVLAAAAFGVWAGGQAP
jgi:chromate transporter